MELNTMVERIDDQPTPDENLLRLKGVYHDRRSGKDRRVGYTTLDPSRDRRKKERRKNWLSKTPRNDKF